MHSAKQARFCEAALVISAARRNTTRGALLLLVSLGALSTAPSFAQSPQNPPPDAVIELWEQNWTLNADGSTVFHEKRHVRLNDDRAYNEFADPRITYNKDTDKLDVLVARVKRPDGSYLTLPDYAQIEVAPNGPAGWPAFASIRQHLFVMSGIEPGCVVELEYKLTSKPGTHSYLAGDVRLDHRYPVKERHVTITVPPDVRLRSAISGLAGAQQPPNAKDIVLHDLPALPDEPQSPPWQVRCPRLLFTTANLASDWLKKRSAQVDTAADQSELITKLADEWTADTSEPADKLRALQEKLAASFNFVEFPVEWRPATLRPASEVLRSGYGLPEESAAVLLALARAVKLPVLPGLLVNDEVWNNEEPQDGMVAAYVVLLIAGRPGEVRMVDNAEQSGGHVPALDTGDYPEIWEPHSGHVVRGGRWAGYTLLPPPDALMPRTLLEPWAKADESQCHVQGKMTVAEDGNFAGTLTLQTTGLFASSESLRSGDAQKARIAVLIGRVLPDASVESSAVRSLTPDTFEVTAQVKSAKPLKRLSERNWVQLAQDGPYLADVPLPLAYSRRETPVRLAGAFDELIDLTITWPEKWQLEARPDDVPRVAGGWGSVEQRVTLAQHALTLHRHTRITARELQPEAFLQARRPLNDLRAEAARTLVLKP